MRRWFLYSLTILGDELIQNSEYTFYAQMQTGHFKNSLPLGETIFEAAFHIRHFTGLF